MTPVEFNRRIKSKNLSGVFFFYGDERYLLENALATIERKIITAGTESFNVIRFDGKKSSVGEIITAIDRFPQMSEMKLIVVNDSGILNNATLSDFKLIKSAAEAIPSDTCLVFCEKSFDKKKLKNLSFIEENGAIVEFEYLPVNKLSILIEDKFQKENRAILDRDIRYLLSLCGQSLLKIRRECDKLLNYTEGRNKVTREDIDAVVDKTVEYRTYDMLDNMIAGNKKKAQEQLKYLKDTNEKPFYILSLMMARLSELLMCKLLKEDGLSDDEIGAYFDFKRPSFVIKKTVSASRDFDEAFLKKMIDKGLYYDIECKQGRLMPWIAVEMYLAELVEK